jgi:hypothetical protein
MAIDVPGHRPISVKTIFKTASQGDAGSIVSGVHSIEAGAAFDRKVFAVSSGSSRRPGGPFSVRSFLGMAWLAGVHADAAVPLHYLWP